MRKLLSCARILGRRIVSRRSSPSFTIATVGALVLSGVGFSPISGGLVYAEPVAADHSGGASVTYRPIEDFLQNNPQSINLNGDPIGNTGSDAPTVVNLGWNPHRFPTVDRNAVSLHNEAVFEGPDWFEFPGGFDSILSETEHPTKVEGSIRQTRLADGGVQIAIRARIKFGAVSIYDLEDIFGERGCRDSGGCNDLPGGGGEPTAVVGQDGDGRFDYELSIDLTYTAEGVELAGGDLDAGINPTIPFVLPADFGITPGVSMQRFTMDGKITATVTEDEALAAKFGLQPGKRAKIRLLVSFDEFIYELIH